MPIFDLQCANGHKHIDRVLRIGERPLCHCGAPTSTLWTSKSACVVGDDIPGGVWIKHGICNADGSPRKYYSKTEMKAEATKRGLMNHVEHIPLRGTDKSPHTVKWSAVPTDLRTREERRRDMASWLGLPYDDYCTLYPADSLA